MADASPVPASAGPSPPAATTTEAAGGAEGAGARADASSSLIRSSSKPSSGVLSARAYHLRPAFQHKFRSSMGKECIHEVLKEMLTNVQYTPEEIPPLTKLLSETIRDRLKEKGFHRYKIVVQVVIGEQRGEGVNMAARC
ncbi:dynein light chain Tctex-type protein 2B [Pogona vitticeps]